MNMKKHQKPPILASILDVSKKWNLSHVHFLGLTMMITISQPKSSRIETNPFQIRKTTILAAILDLFWKILPVPENGLHQWISGPKISRHSMFSNVRLLWQKMSIWEKVNFILEARAVAHFVGISLLINLS